MPVCYSRQIIGREISSNLIHTPYNYLYYTITFLSVKAGKCQFRYLPPLPQNDRSGEKPERASERENGGEGGGKPLFVGPMLCANRQDASFDRGGRGGGVRQMVTRCKKTPFDFLGGDWSAYSNGIAVHV